MLLTNKLTLHYSDLTWPISLGHVISINYIHVTSLGLAAASLP